MAREPIRVRTAGAYIIRAAESRPTRVTGELRADYEPPVPTEADRALARALLRAKGRP